MKGLKVTIAGVLLTAIVLVGLDWVIFKLRGSPTSEVTVHLLVSAPLKGNKQEMDYLGDDQRLCTQTLFPQPGMMPCWYLMTHKNQVTTY